MRLVVVLAVLISVAAQAHAEGPRQSRYGPTTPRQEAAAVAAATVRYEGPMLGWAGKREIVAAAVAAPTAAAPTLPAPVASWAGYQTPPVPPAYTPPPAPMSAPPSAPLPTSLYATPRAAQPMAPQPVASRGPAQAAAPAAVDWSNYRSSRVAPLGATNPPAPAPAPANLYAQPIAAQPIARPAATTPPPPSAPQPRPQPQQVAAANTGGPGARFYSVDREYGMTPDAIPPAGADTRVLITATDPPPEAKDAVPMHGSADWLAAGVRGDDEDDSSTSKDRRAKTRDEAL
jgi:hypothetical protein